MGVFEELDAEIAAKAIEGYENELSAETQKLDAFYRQFDCPRCGGGCQRETLPGHAFNDPDTLVPRSVLRCRSCSCLFDPHTGLLLDRGTPPRGAPVDLSRR